MSLTHLAPINCDRISWKLPIVCRLSIEYSKLAPILCARISCLIAIINLLRSRFHECDRIYFQAA
ncbi:hypothetical protein NIES2104_56300 [Leptolyngbya sp. NIES-2104]|nr:hypothetical protein NIES2104_56300 [Leptolyngbya sp. NIES-2104]